MRWISWCGTSKVDVQLLKPVVEISEEPRRWNPSWFWVMKMLEPMGWWDDWFYRNTWMVDFSMGFSCRSINLLPGKWWSVVLWIHSVFYLGLPGRLKVFHVMFGDRHRGSSQDLDTWLVIMVSKWPKSGCSPCKWPFTAYKLRLLTIYKSCKNLILQVDPRRNGWTSGNPALKLKNENSVLTIS